MSDLPTPPGALTARFSTLTDTEALALLTERRDRLTTPPARPEPTIKIKKPRIRREWFLQRIDALGLAPPLPPQEDQNAPDSP